MQRRLTAGGIPPQSVTWEIRVIASPDRKGQKGEERLFQETPVANKSDSVLSSSSKAALENVEKAALDPSSAADLGRGPPPLYDANATQDPPLPLRSARTI
ncbi:unnamed protein product [Pleuronectes platessa]|uniref:Uncharacterized protein n=1 Tax=Pleuronectes platessa TaxID=8262 RepID=A0A9N7UY73_PLEPL|nr:unnamed protein product [Pleuronectes platessa]